jgi:hypothetical protein
MVSVKSTIAEEHGSKIQYLDKSKIDFEQTTCTYFTFINENGKPEKTRAERGNMPAPYTKLTYSLFRTSTTEIERERMISNEKARTTTT